jgi:hypothetical protein
MLEITRELVEHYLRVAGWEPSTLGFWTRRGRQVGTFDGMTTFDIDRAIEEIATSDRLTRSALAFRLGLCAAAERRFVHARFIKINNPTALPTDRVTLVHAVEQGEGEELLKCAGIDPLAWESARKR